MRDYALWDLATANISARAAAPGFAADLAAFREKLAAGEVPVDPFHNASARRAPAPRPAPRVWKPKRKAPRSYYKPPAGRIADPSAADRRGPPAAAAAARGRAATASQKAATAALAFVFGYGALKALGHCAGEPPPEDAA